MKVEVMKESENKPIICGDCFEVFTTRHNLDDHITSKICTGEKPFVCDESGNLAPVQRIDTGEKPYSCPQCDKRFESKNDLKSHLRIHLEAKSYLCVICDGQFSEKREWKSHLTIHSGESSDACKVCEYESNDEERFKRHVARHEGDKTHPCPFCDEKFALKLFLFRHMKSHFRIKLTNACTVCAYKTDNKTKLRKHIAKHPGAKQFGCNQCDKTFKLFNSLKNHLNKHAGEKPFSCNQCDARFSRKYQWKAHTAIHSGVKLYECGECEYNCVRENKILSHMNQHREAYTPHICPICSKTFKKVVSLKRHINFHKTTVWSCSICDFQHAQRYRLLYHMKKHADTKEYKCDQCGREFKHATSLHHHTRRSHSGPALLSCKECKFKCAYERELDIHMGECAKKKQKCDQCGKKFRWISKLKQHLMIHTGEKPFACSLCEYRSAVKYSLDVHMKSHTGQQRSYACGQCDKIFTSSYCRLQHSRLHFKETPHACGMGDDPGAHKESLNEPSKVHATDEPLVCDQCPRKFKLMCHLKRHSLVHRGSNSAGGSGDSPEKSTGPKSYSYMCTLCDKRFTRLSYLRIHVSSVHHGEKQYLCHLCDFQSGYPSSLRSHMQKMHNDR